LKATLNIVTDTKTVRVPVSMTSQGATLTLKPSIADFGFVSVGVQANDIPLTLTNTGNVTATLSLGTPSDTDFSVGVGSVATTDGGVPEGGAAEAGAVDAGGAGSFVIQPNGTVPGLVAHFKPTTLNAATTSSAITVQGAVCSQDTSVTSIPLKGQGTSGVVGVSPATLDFGLVDCGTRGTLQIFGIVNSGNASFNWTAALGNTTNPNFTISPTSGTVLPNGQSFVFVTPNAIPQTSATTPDLYGDTITVTTTVAGDTPHTVTLLETAHGAILTFSASSLPFGTQTLFGPASTQILSVTNTGNATASVTLIDATTTNSSFGFSPSGANNVAPGATNKLGVTVSFSPTGFGAINDSVSMSTSSVLCNPLPTATSLTGSGKGVASQVAVGGGPAPRRTFPAVACAVITGGHVACWGDNAYGQMGQGSTSTTVQKTPVVVPGLSGVTAVSTSGEHVCAVTGTGGVSCWGRGSGRTGGGGGQLGNGTTTDESSPTSASITGATAIAVAHRHSCALVPNSADAGGNNSVYCWGAFAGNHAGGANYKIPTLMAGISDATGFAVGSFGVCAVRVGGTVACLGDDNKGSFGNGTTNFNEAVAFQPDVTGLTGVTSIGAGGANHRESGAVCAVHGGAVSCWGNTKYGVLGSLTSTSCVPGCTASGPNVCGLGLCGCLPSQYCCCGCSNPVGSCWSGTTCGQAWPYCSKRQSQLTPLAVAGISTATQVVAGNTHVCVLLASGAIQCWGSNLAGELGNGSTTDSITPVNVAGISNATQISAGHEVTCARLSTGSVNCWGDNTSGELGNPSAVGTTPSTVSGF
jgi:alpha-tubulin suppressor-like RCC1 family protein